ECVIQGLTPDVYRDLTGGVLRLRLPAVAGRPGDAGRSGNRGHIGLVLSHSGHDQAFQLALGTLCRGGCLADVLQADHVSPRWWRGRGARPLSRAGQASSRLLITFWTSR